MSDLQHKLGITDANANKILYNRILIDIFNNKNIKPNEEYYFIEGDLAGKSFAFNLEKDKKNKQSDCYTPDGGTQSDDKPQLIHFSHLNPEIILELINPSLNLSFSDQSKLRYLEIISLYKSLIDEYLNDYIIILACRTNETPAPCYLVKVSDPVFQNLKTKKWDTFGFDSYYYDTTLKLNIIEPNSIKNIKRHGRPNSNWKP